MVLRRSFNPSLSHCCHLEYTGLPGSFIQIQTMGPEIAAFVIAGDIAQLVLEPPGMAVKVVKR